MNKDLQQKSQELADRPDDRQGEPLDSPKLFQLSEYFLDRYGLLSINVSNRMTRADADRVYKTNMGRSVILLLERNEHNEHYFVQHGASSIDDVMMIYKQRYLCFDNATEYHKALEEMHKTIVA